MRKWKCSNCFEWHIYSLPRKDNIQPPVGLPSRLLLATALARPRAWGTSQLSRMSEPASTSYPALHAFLAHTDESYHEDMPALEIRNSLLRWYAVNRRRLPWRGDAPPYNGSTAGTNSNKTGSSATVASPLQDPPLAVSAYGVWVSEIMCQQTRIEAVIPYWLAWMKSFPTVEALAAASEDEVNAHWAGLGFYRRARMLHEGSKQVVRDFDGELPGTVDELMKLKGVGRYTAGAIASISFGVAAPIVDGNVLRVLSRLCAISAHVKEPTFCSEGKLAWRLAQQLVEADCGAKAGDLNQAIMELGATLCAPDGTGEMAENVLVTAHASPSSILSFLITAACPRVSICHSSLETFALCPQQVLTLATPYVTCTNPLKSGATHFVLMRTVPCLRS